MAVVVKYVVERNGKEIMTFADKKQADAYDKQLDIAERLQDFLAASELQLELSSDQLDELTLYMAKHRDAVIKMLKGQNPTAAQTNAPPAKQSDTDTNTDVVQSSEKPPAGRAKRGAKVKPLAA